LAFNGNPKKPVYRFPGSPHTKMMKMNLATDPWIPVVWSDGKCHSASLEDVFRENESIRDLAVRPHERIAVMRLLLAVAHAGISGPRNQADWEVCRNKIGLAAMKHLQKYRHVFELFGESSRLSQLYSGTNYAPKPDPKEPMWAGKLELALATGNNPTVFDNAGTEPRAFPPAELARMLVAYQACSPLIGRGYKGRSPCVEGNMLHTLLRGANLLETLWLNLLDRETVEVTYGVGSWGQPVWLDMPHSPADKDAIHNATSTYLGRLVPLPRAIWLADNCRTIALNNGLEYPAWDGDPAEPSATVTVKDKKVRKVFAARLDRAVWRDLPSLAVKQRSDGSHGALAWQRFPEDRPCDLWVGALVTDGKAKLLNTVQSIFALPTNASNDEFINYYGGGVAFAEWWARAIEKGLSAYRRLLGDNIDRREARKRAALMKQRAASRFWTAVEASVRDVLIPLAASPPDELKCGGPFYLDYRRRESRWGPRVRDAAEEALALACPQSSARQAAAFGAGRWAMLRNQPYTKEAGTAEPLKRQPPQPQNR